MNKNKKSHIKLGDTIKVISGSNKGFIGKINTVIFKKSIVFIEGIIPRIKYSKTRESGEAKKVSLPIPIHISNVMLWDAEVKIASRVGYKFNEKKKYRYFKKSGNKID